MVKGQLHLLCSRVGGQTKRLADLQGRLRDLAVVGNVGLQPGSEAGHSAAAGRAESRASRKGGGTQTHCGDASNSDLEGMYRVQFKSESAAK